MTKTSPNVRLYTATRASAPNMAPSLAQAIIDDRMHVLLISTRSKATPSRSQQHLLRVARPGDNLGAICIDWPGPGNKAFVIVDGQPVYLDGKAHPPIKPAELAKLAHAARAALRHRVEEITVLCDASHAEEVQALLESHESNTRRIAD